MKTSTTVYLGRTAENELVFANVRIEDADPNQTVTFTDHTEGPRPAGVAISFSLIEASRTPHADQGRAVDYFSDKRWIGAGQVDPDNRILVGEVPAAARVIEQAWSGSHLNLMNAACDHMTEDMLNPSDDLLNRYIADMAAAFYGRRDALHKWRMDGIVCPVTGYRYGHAWLARKVDDDVIRSLRDAVAELTEGVR